MKKKLCFLLFLLYFIYENRSLNIKKINVNVEKSVPNYKIAFFSDTHFGKSYSEKNIEKIVKKINNENVDVIIFGGDFFDNYDRDKEKLDVDFLYENLSKLNSKYGKYAVYGNHDFGGKADRVFYDLLSNSGFNILMNENIYINDLNTRLIGFEDKIWGKTKKEYYNIKSTDFNIILSHEPDIIDMIFSENYGIMLSGHTHGGQIYIPYIVNHVLPKYGEKYIKGMYNNVSKNNNMSLFVSSGIGNTGIPFRFFNKPEICIIEMKNGL